MLYMLLIYTDQAADAQRSPEESNAIFAAYGAYTAEVTGRGIHVGGEALHPAATATTVRVRGGDVLKTDGPFAETKEQLGGYYLLECADIDEAIDWAARMPSASYGSIEIRPVLDLSGSM